MISQAKKSVSDLLSRTRSAGQELREGVESLRGRIAHLQDQKTEVEALPPTLDIALKRIDEYALSLRPLEGYPTPSRFASSSAHYERPRYSEPLDVMRYYLARTLAESIKAEVKAHYANLRPITEEERTERLAKLDRELLDAELAEESIVRAAEAAGFPIQRRMNADPRAVLAHEKALP